MYNHVDILEAIGKLKLEISVATSGEVPALLERLGHLVGALDIPSLITDLTSPK